MSQQPPPPFTQQPPGPPPYGSPPAPQPSQQAWVPPVAGPAPGVAYASAGSRLVAYIVDAVVTWILIFVVSLVLGGIFAAGASSDNGGAVAGTSMVVWLLAIFVIWLGYFPWFWAHGGATPGMKMFHIRVVREVDGGPVTGGQAIMRLIGYWVSSFIFYLGFIWILIDAHKQGWHDKIANTVVVESR